MQEREDRIAAGEWWADMAPYRILIGCHYSGAKKKDERGDLRATSVGLEYKATLGTRVKIPWGVVRDIEVGTQATKRVTAGRVLAVGVFALAAKKNEKYTYVHISDQNTVWSFATKADQGKVVKALQPVLTRFNKRVSAQDERPTATPNTISVADELTKLLDLKYRQARSQTRSSMHRRRSSCRNALRVGNTRPRPVGSTEVVGRGWSPAGPVKRDLG